MDSRRKLALDVLEGGVSLSEACVRAGVTRKTGRKWVIRAREVGILNLAELSRAPQSRPTKTDSAVEAALCELKELYPEWGAKKLVAVLSRQTGVVVPLRTADRVLERLGLTRPRTPRAEPPIRFERATCGALLQMDFKGLPLSTPYALLTVLDDMARFCYHFAPVPDKTGPSVCAALWQVFGQHGLPDEILMDNGDCWGSRPSAAPTRFEAWLMRLGVRPIHGRPRHPQTQGKVERFHGTAKIELGADLVQTSLPLASQACKRFVDRYNWDRPHEGIGFQVPGDRYAPWPRERPEKPPPHRLPEGAITRKVCMAGCFTYQGKTYHLGKGLIGETIVLKEAEFGMRTYYAHFPLAYLYEIHKP